MSSSETRGSAWRPRTAVCLDRSDAQMITIPAAVSQSGMMDCVHHEPDAAELPNMWREYGNTFYIYSSIHSTQPSIYLDIGRPGTAFPVTLAFSSQNQLNPVVLFNTIWQRYLQPDKRRWAIIYKTLNNNFGQSPLKEIKFIYKKHKNTLCKAVEQIFWVL